MALEKSLRIGDVKSVAQALGYTTVVSQSIFWLGLPGVRQNS